MHIKYSRQAAKFIASQDKDTKQRLKRGIEGLTEIPPSGDVKLLQGYKNKVYRLRIGKYRIIFYYENDTYQQRILFISDVDSRGDIYK